MRTTETIPLAAPPASTGRWPRVRSGLADPRVQSGLALVGFVLLSVLLFGLPVLRHPTRWYVGLGDRSLGTGWTDPSFYMWNLAWWPHALVHGIDPRLARLVWAPGGVDLAWTTSVPGAAILAWPLTALAGPVAAYDGWILLAPALAGWAAYLLCRHLTDSFWPSVAGGLLFGFSSYELAQMTAHLNLALVFPLPLAVLLVVRLVDGSIRPAAFVPLLALVVALQFSFSSELVLVGTAFGLLALGLAWVASPGRRGRIALAGLWTAAGVVGAGILVAPLLLPSLRGLRPLIPPGWRGAYTTDLANLIRPTRVALIAPLANPTSTPGFAAGLAEAGAYLGPLLLVVAAFLIRHRRSARAVVLGGTFVLGLVASLGAVVRIDGASRWHVPWAGLFDVPFVRYALPARFIVVPWLAAAVMAATWLADRPPRPAMRWLRPTVGAICLVALAPNLSLPLWRAEARTPAFFSDGLYREYVKPDHSMLVLPFAGNGFSMLWQAESGFGFTMAGGYTACRIPQAYQRYAAVAAFVAKRRVFDFSDQLRAFVAHFDVATVVVVPTTEGTWPRVFAALSLRPVDVGGVLVARIPLPWLALWRTLDPPNVASLALARTCQ